MYNYFFVGSNWDMSLSDVQLRKISKPLVPTNFVKKLKSKQKSFKIYKFTKIKRFAKYRSNSSNKAEKEMIEAESVLKIKL